MAAMELNKEQFEKLMNDGKVVLVDFWAPWCSYCRRIAPAYDKIAQQFGDELIISKINIDNEPILAHKEQIEVIPTLVLYKDGKSIGSSVAPESKAVIENFIRIDYVEGEKNSFTLFVSNDLKVRRLLNLFNNDELKDKNKITYNLKYDEDLVVSGLGFIKIVDKGTINIYIDKDVDTFIRKSLI